MNKADILAAMPILSDYIHSQISDKLRTRIANEMWWSVNIRQIKSEIHNGVLDYDQR